MRLSKSDVDSFPRFCIASADFFVVDSLCFFTGNDLNTIVNVLNSEFATYYFFNNVTTLDNGGFQMRQQFVEEIPLPKIAHNINVTDSIIYNTFGFTNEEILYIQNFITRKKKEIVIS